MCKVVRLASGDMWFDVDEAVYIIWFTGVEGVVRGDLVVDSSIFSQCRDLTAFLGNISAQD